MWHRLLWRSSPSNTDSLSWLEVTACVTHMPGPQHTLMSMMRIQKSIFQPIARVTSRMDPSANNCIAHLHTQGTEDIHICLTMGLLQTTDQYRTQVGIPAKCQIFGGIFTHLLLISGLNSRFGSDTLTVTHFGKKRLASLGWRRQ